MCLTHLPREGIQLLLKGGPRAPPLWIRTCLTHFIYLGEASVILKYKRPGLKTCSVPTKYTM